MIEFALDGRLQNAAMKVMQMTNFAVELFMAQIISNQILLIIISFAVTDEQCISFACNSRDVCHLAQIQQGLIEMLCNLDIRL